MLIRSSLMTGLVKLLCPQPVEVHLHYEIWEYCQSTSKVQASVLQNPRLTCSHPLKHDTTDPALTLQEFMPVLQGQC